ncbi:hypothetical protein SNEBB_004685 [Seison nebaliae]|nr:hypothetical protein SNEBB_004685 [Seison nebaliae]
MFLEICFFTFFLGRYSSAISVAGAVARGLSSNNIFSTKCVVKVSENVDIVKLRKFVRDGHQICDLKEKSFKRWNDFGFTCLKEGNIFIIYQNVILGRSLSENRSSLPERWNDHNDFDVDEPIGNISLNFSKRYKSKLLTKPLNIFKYIQVDFHTNNQIMARFIFSNLKVTENNDGWFKKLQMKNAIGSFAPGCKRYDLNEITSTIFNTENLILSNQPRRRPLSFIQNYSNCDRDSILLTIVTAKDVCYKNHEKLSLREYKSDYILYSCGPSHNTRDKMEIADDVTIIALY